MNQFTYNIDKLDVWMKRKEKKNLNKQFYSKNKYIIIAYCRITFNEIMVFQVFIVKSEIFRILWWIILE
jgi:arginine/ornithine N-succinyltransferase beta subunit